MIMVGRDSRREARKMAVRVSATSGFDLGYVWRNLGGEPERTAGGYYINAAQAGEAPGRWFGAGAEAAGLAEGSVVDRDVYDQVYNQVSPLTGQKMGARRADTPSSLIIWPGWRRPSRMRRGSGAVAGPRGPLVRGVAGRQRPRPAVSP